MIVRVKPIRPVVVALIAHLAAVICAHSQTVSVDPSTPLQNYWGPEWNTDGGFESWTATNLNSTSVSGGTLNGTRSGTNPYITRANIASGPDLDLGYNDFVDVRVSFPSGYTGSLVVAFGVTNAGTNLPSQTGISTSREVVIPNGTLIKDGSLHNYRIDMGLVPLWRGTLNDLRVILRGAAASQSFSFDYVRVGDESGNDYTARISDVCPAANTVKDVDGRIHTIRSLESKRFRIIWSDLTETEDPGVPWDATKSRGTLRNLEEIWQVYVKKHGYKESCYPMNAPSSPVKYKTNMTMIYLGGTWAGGDNDPAHGGSFGWQNTYPAATSVDPPSWVNAHEFMHVTQMHQDGTLKDNGPTGPWWEAHANYGQEIWLEHYAIHYPTPDNSGLAPSFLATSFLHHGHGRHYYDHWPIFTYLDRNPDALADLGGDLTRRLWRESASEGFIYQEIENLTPTTGLKEIIGNYARRNISWDYGSRQADMLANTAEPDQEWLNRYRFPALVRRADDNSWWHVPQSVTPNAFAYNLHELVQPGAGTVTVNFRGYQDADRQSDWRASLVKVNTGNVATYSPLFGHNQSQSLTVAATDKVYLSVAATPGEILAMEISDSAQSYQSHPAKTRFPYEIQVTGATPKGSGTGTSTLLTHTNGGGKKASTATVESTAYIGPDARVLDYAVVRGNARIEDNAVVSGHALIKDNAIVRGFARVREYGMMESNTIAEGNARVGGHHKLIEDARATGNATLKGNGSAWGTAVISGDGILDGDYVGGNNVSNGVQFGWEWGGQTPEYIAAHTAPAGLFSSYPFDTAPAHSAKDKYGITDASLVGSPTWTATDGTRAGFLSFNGAGQYALLNRWHSDFRAFTVTCRVKWAGTGTANQPIFHFGDGTATKRLYVTPSDAAGKCALVIHQGGSTYTVQAAAALPSNTWSRVGIILDGSTASLYVDGTPAGSTACPARPEDLLPADTNETPAHNYLARGTSLPDFQGSLDNFNVYSSASPDFISGDTLNAVLLARYKFDETSGSTANDSTPNNNHASLINGPVWNAAEAALTFDGVDDHVQTPVPNGTSRTLAAWIYPRSSDDVADIESVFDCDVPGQYGTGWGLDNGKIKAVLDDEFWDTGVNITLNRWQHVALTYGASSARLYVNGALAASLSYTQGGVTSANYRIGRSNANDQFFHGDISDARIYNLSANDTDAAAIFLDSGNWPVPHKPSATAGPNAGEVVLSWLPVAGATGYIIERSLSSGSGFSEIATVGPSTLSYTDTGITSPGTYFYRIKATGGGYSTEVSWTVLATPADGAWNNPAGGAWNTAGNWLANTIAAGTDRSATFNLASPLIITQSSAAYPLGGMTFSNANHTVQGGSFQLDVTSGNPLISVASGFTATIHSGISGSDGLSKTGAGTLALGASNTWSGPTTIPQGTLQVLAGGSLGATTNNLTLGTGSSGVIGSVGNLIIGETLSTGNLTFQHNTADLTTPANIAQLAIASGKTLSTTGFTVGVTGGSARTALATSGGGSLVVNGPIVFGKSSSAYSVTNLSGLGSFQNTYAGDLLIGYESNNDARVYLASTSNSIALTGDIAIGFSAGNYNTAHSILHLGAGTNTLQANRLFIGYGKGGGKLQFAGSSGSASITGVNGAPNKISVLIGGATTLTYNTGDRNCALDLAGHNASVLASSVTVGQRAGATGGNLPLARVTFDTGSFTTDTLTLANSNSGNNANTTLSGTFTLGTTSASTGTLTVLSAFDLAKVTNANAADTVSATFTVNGGLADIRCPIKDTSTTGTSNTTLTLNGGTLDMNGFSIGGDDSAGNRRIDTLNLQSGTLRNVSQINNGDPITKSTVGTLVIAGTNTFTGPTTVAAGKLALTGTLASSITATAGTVSPQGTPATTGSLAINSGGRLEVRIYGPAIGSGHDQLTIGSDLTLAGALDIIPGPGLTAGSTFTILNKTSAGPISGAFTGKPEGSFFSAGGYDWIIRYTGGTGNDVTLTIATAMQSWRQLHFATISETGDAANTADPDNDGENNLLEFATGQNPHAATKAPVSLIFAPASMLRFTYTRLKAATTDVSFLVEWSDTLANDWSTTAVSYDPPVEINAATESVTATFPAGPGTRRFARLRVTAP